MKIIATDLDRTLLPNGKQQYDNSMNRFNDIIVNNNLKLIYVTGRNLKLVKDAMKQFNAPNPDYIIGDVGTKIYAKKSFLYIEDNGWIRHINSVTKNWDLASFKKELKGIEGLELQEKSKQNRFKLSYYIDDTSKSDDIVRIVKSKINKICSDTVIIYSIDETINQGLLDILPKKATKLTGIEYLRTKLRCEIDDIVYCGDSGNDILPLTFGYKSILVRNAIMQVKKEVKEKIKDKSKLYIAKGTKDLNGYYVSGIIEGLHQFGI